MCSSDLTDCFTHLIEQITLYCERNRVRGDALEIALRLWTFVHGAASLLIDKDYLQIAPQLDVNGLIANATPGLLASSPRRVSRLHRPGALAARARP